MKNLGGRLTQTDLDDFKKGLEAWMNDLQQQCGGEERLTDAEGMYQYAVRTHLQGDCCNKNAPEFVTNESGDAALPTSGLSRFSTGAVRSSDADSTRYDLISTVGLRRLAETYAEGAKKYSDRNWEKGIPATTCLNHLIRHIELWRAGDASEDHLAHAAWGLFAVMHYEELLPEMIDLPTRMVPA